MEWPRFARRDASGDYRADQRDRSDLTADIGRAARILEIRCRREASGLFSGQYASAFRGKGMEFEESRPYVAGDDVRHLDWNAIARTGQPHVKRYREERDRTLLLALDTSAPMSFGTTGPALAEHGAHAFALLATAAARAGDRIGFLAAGRRTSTRLEPRRGAAQSWAVIRAATRAAHATATAPTSREGRSPAPPPLDLAGLADGLERDAARRSAIFVASSFRGADPLALGALASLAEQHALVCLILHDPGDVALPAVGPLRVGADGGPRRLLDTRAASTRSAYARAWRAHRDGLERRLRGLGCDTLWLRTDHDPLAALIRFFQRRGVGRARR